MIKFVCASCGERLSVPDQHGGRKGRCPICQSVNQIPLKGFAETQPKSPTVARTAPASAQTPMLDERETPQTAPVAARELEPAVKPIENSVGPEMSASASVVPVSPAASTERFTSATKFIVPPDDAANLRDIRRARQKAAKTTSFPESSQRSVREWHLPRQVKIALLILAALAVVGALYFGLLMALRAAAPGA